jgi:hypothetical protein
MSETDTAGCCYGVVGGCERHRAAALSAVASRVVSSAFDIVRAEAERHGFDVDWIEGLENLRDAVARTPGVR